jgi:hypothetical protein
MWMPQSIWDIGFRTDQRLKSLYQCKCRVRSFFGTSWISLIRVGSSRSGFFTTQSIKSRVIRPLDAPALPLFIPSRLTAIVPRSVDIAQSSKNGRDNIALCLPNMKVPEVRLADCTECQWNLIESIGCSIEYRCIKTIRIPFQKRCATVNNIWATTL